MDLLSSLLRVAEAEEYVNDFRNNGIDPFTLKLLDHKDLTALGITDESKRNIILKNIANLQIPAEKRKNIDIDQTYSTLVLYQMSNQLHKHLANLSCAVMRNDVVVCDVRLGPSVKCLNECIDSLEDEVKKMTLLSRSKKRSKKNPVVFGLILSMLVASSFVFIKFVIK